MQFVHKISITVTTNFENALFSDNIHHSAVRDHKLIANVSVPNAGATNSA